MEGSQNLKSTGSHKAPKGAWPGSHDLTSFSTYLFGARL